MAGVWTRNYTNLLACCFGMEHKDSWTPTTLSVQPSDYSNDTIYFRYSSSAWYPCKGINTNGSGTGSNIYAINYMACTSVSLPFSGVYGRNPQAYGASGTNCRCEIGIQCGSGSLGSANIYDAYDLNTPITSGLSMSAPVPEVTTTYDSTYHKYTKTTSFGISNVSSNNISISEIGLFLPAPYSYNSTVPVLCYYDTFETITLEPYESVVITLSQSFPLINYEPYPVE